MQLLERYSVLTYNIDQSTGTCHERHYIASGLSDPDPCLYKYRTKPNMASKNWTTIYDLFNPKNHVPDSELRKWGII